MNVNTPSALSAHPFISASPDILMIADKLAVSVRYRPYVVPEEQVVILHDQIEPLVLRGRAVSLITPYLDGTHTLETLAEELRQVLPPETTVHVVAHLIRDGIVILTNQ